jgi:hypothetical protein
MASARCTDHGLQLPGQVSAGIRWRGRFDALLLPGELRVVGHGGVWRYPVADMVFVSDGGLGPSGLRVDFLVGSPLLVDVCDGGEIIEGLRRQLLEYERSLSNDSHIAAWPATGRLVAIVPARSEPALNAAIGLLLHRTTRGRVTGDETAPVGGAHTGFTGLVDDLRAHRRGLLARNELAR